MPAFPLALHLADHIDHFSPFKPFYKEPQVLDLLHWAHRLNHLSRAMQVRDNAVSHVGKDGFQVSMDVSQFKPSELNVKVVEDLIVVEGKHEEREDDHGYISRHFVRRYVVPKGYDPEKVASALSSDGVLSSVRRNSHVKHSLEAARKVFVVNKSLRYFCGSQAITA